MAGVEKLITEHIDVWTSAIKKRNATGRGSNKKIELTGIKKLRELILELAVRGKLVPQDANHEPASVLLAKIAKEKAQLLKDKLIKKPKKLPEIDEEDKTISLPEGWEFVRLNELGEWGAGATPRRGNSELYGGDIPWFKSGELNADYIDKSEETVTELALKQASLRYNKIGDVLLAMYGATIGKTAILKVRATTNQAVCACTPFTGFSNIFLLTLLKAYKLKFIGMGAGGAQPNISREKIIATVIALPPLAEQQRIVAKVDALMALCDQLEQQTEQSLTAHQTLVEVLLASLTSDTSTDGDNKEDFQTSWQRIAEHFDVLFTTEASIEQLKQTILQLAVMGKLVPQNPNDEPAPFLMERLAIEQKSWLENNLVNNAECKTMLRKLNKLKSVNAPFLLPKSWACVHLIQTSQLLVDCHNKTAPYTDSGIPIIRTTNIREREFRFEGLRYVNEDTYDYWSRRCPPESGDIMFTREAPMGEAAIIPKGVKWCLGQRTMLIRPMHEYVSNKFILLALTEPHLLERASEHAVGLTVKHLRVGDVENLNIPLPPLAEQHRIVSKVDELMALCGQLKARLADAQTTQLHLADAVVENALT
jgi:type I restriction enzyme S subunit